MNGTRGLRAGLIGLGAAGEEGFALGAERGAEAVAERGGVFDEEEAWDVLEEIPPGSAGLLVLLDAHRLTGRLPFEAADARALLAMHIATPAPPVASRAPGVRLDALATLHAALNACDVDARLVA